MNLLRSTRRERAAGRHSAHSGGAPYSANWRDGYAVAAGLLVLLVTAWLIWAALAEALLAQSQAA